MFLVSVKENRVKIVLARTTSMNGDRGSVLAIRLIIASRSFLTVLK